VVFPQDRARWTYCRGTLRRGRQNPDKPSFIRRAAAAGRDIFAIRAVELRRTGVMLAEARTSGARPRKKRGWPRFNLAGGRTPRRLPLHARGRCTETDDKRPVRPPMSTTGGDARAQSFLADDRRRPSSNAGAQTSRHRRESGRVLERAIAVVRCGGRSSGADVVIRRRAGADRCRAPFKGRLKAGWRTTDEGREKNGTSYRTWPAGRDVLMASLPSPKATYVALRTGRHRQRLGKAARHRPTAQTVEKVDFRPGPRRRHRWAQCREYGDPSARNRAGGAMAPARFLQGRRAG